jgi:hypothetical protein
LTSTSEKWGQMRTTLMDHRSLVITCLVFSNNRIIFKLGFVCYLLLDGGEWSASRPSHFTPVPILRETGWVPEPVWTWWQRKKVPSLALPGTEPWLSSP